jgi:hypothetical protein
MGTSKTAPPLEHLEFSDEQAPAQEAAQERNSNQVKTPEENAAECEANAVLAQSRKSAIGYLASAELYLQAARAYRDAASVPGANVQALKRSAAACARRASTACTMVADTLE